VKSMRRNSGTPLRISVLFQDSCEGMNAFEAFCDHGIEPEGYGREVHPPDFPKPMQLDRAYMAQHFPKTLRTLYRGCRA